MGFQVVVGDRNGTPEVSILEDDSPLFTRLCSSTAEAEVFASTVRQHIRWLSEDRFRSYYRL